jgi:hypothetical protein
MIGNDAGLQFLSRLLRTLQTGSLRYVTVKAKFNSHPLSQLTNARRLVSTQNLRLLYFARGDLGSGAGRDGLR